MKKHILLFSLMATLLILNGCRKNCSCDSTNPEQNVSSASKGGSVVFWTPNLAAHGGFVNVTINGLTRTIITNWITPPPNCLSTNGVAYFYLDEGTYSYTTVDYFGFTSKGTVTFVADNCNKQRIE